MNCDYSEFLKDEFLVQEVCERFDIPFGGLWGDPIPCPLIGINEKAEAGFADTDSGHIVLNVFNTNTDEKRTWTLQELYANRVSNGKVKKLESKGQKGLWLTRMLWDFGRIQLPEVDYRPLPEDSPREMHSWYEGFILAIRCHKAYDITLNKTAFSDRFASEWTGLAKNTCTKYRHKLQRVGYIKEVGTILAENGREMSTYQPVV